MILLANCQQPLKVSRDEPMALRSGKTFRQQYLLTPQFDRVMRSGAPTAHDVS